MLLLQEVSLAEQQAAREAAANTDPPLTNLSEARLRRRFAASAVLEALDAAALPSVALFCNAPPLRELLRFRLVELLRLEGDCMRWYPGEPTRRHFARAARE